MNIAKAPQLIRTTGLGSCVGVVLFDERKQISGMAHVMLPNSELTRVKPINKAKYADTAIPLLLENLIKWGAGAHEVKAKIAGGSQMFQFAGGNEMMRVGPRNVEAVKKELDRLHIRLVAEDTGGNKGRTIEFNPQTAELSIKTIDMGIYVI